MAVVADASALALDAVVDAAFAGRTAEIEAQFAKARTAGTSPGTIVSAALRQVAQLHKARLAVEPARRFGQRGAGGIRRSCISAASTRSRRRCKTWTSPRLERAMEQLADAALETRRQPGMADAIAQRTLLSLAVNARRRE